MLCGRYHRFQSPDAGCHAHRRSDEHVPRAASTFSKTTSPPPLDPPPPPPTSSTGTPRAETPSSFPPFPSSPALKFADPPGAMLIAAAMSMFRERHPHSPKQPRPPQPDHASTFPADFIAGQSPRGNAPASSTVSLASSARICRFAGRHAYGRTISMLCGRYHRFQSPGAMLVAAPRNLGKRVSALNRVHSAWRRRRIRRTPPGHHAARHHQRPDRSPKMPHEKPPHQFAHCPKAPQEQAANQPIERGKPTGHHFDAPTRNRFPGTICSPAAAPQV